jgi:signal peptidase I
LNDSFIMSGDDARSTEKNRAATHPVAGQPARVQRVDALVRAGLRGMWFVAIPGLLAGLVVRYLVPTVTESHGTWAEGPARFADDHEVLVAMGLFLLFSVLTRYWFRVLPSGRFLVPSPVARAVGAAGGKKRNALFVATIALAAIGAVVVRGVFFGSYRVLSASMLPTLEPNDLLAGSRVAYGFRFGSTAPWFGARAPKRGDIVVFKKPAGIDGPDRLVKRILGLPGDRIGMNGGHVVLNGVQVPSCDAGTYLYPVTDGAVRGRLSVEFVDDHAYLTVFAPGPDPWPFTYEVKPGEVFVLGDNRNNSSDSRSWNHGEGGGLALSEIEARTQWRLLGAHRNDRMDFLDAFRPLELHIRLEGMEVRSLQEGIDNCLRERPLQSPASEAHVP